MYPTCFYALKPMAHLNLSELNEYTVYRHFKMDHLCSVMRILPKGSYMATIDITSAYFAIPVKFRDRDLL